MPDIFSDQENLPSNLTPVPVIKPTRVFHPLRMLSTFVQDPLGVSLIEQAADEHILLFIRRDFITNVPWFVSTFILLIAPILLPLVLQSVHWSLAFIPQTFLVIITLFYYLIAVGFAFANFVTWFYGIGIVTQRRAIDIDLYNISYASVATAKVQDLKDVRYFQRGFFQSFFDYGDVTMVVEASGETLTFEQTPRPAQVVSLLSSLIGGHE